MGRARGREIDNTSSFDHLPENEAAWLGAEGGAAAAAAAPLSAWREAADGGMSAAQKGGERVLAAMVSATRLQHGRKCPTCESKVAGRCNAA